MPITQERQTIQDLRDAGFSQQQAEVLAAKLEATAQATQQDLKEFIHRELTGLEARLDARFAGLEGRIQVHSAEVHAELRARFAESDAKLAELRTEVHATQKDLAYKLIATLVAVVSLAVAIIKLFPNAH
jgi:hypothetical protein